VFEGAVVLVAGSSGGDGLVVGRVVDGRGAGLVLLPVFAS
jgi:hypothetical protein